MSEPTWTFNHDYNDLAQVIPFIDSYYEIYDDLIEREKYPYNSDFEGKIDGITGLDKEETPIYLLQKLRHLVDGHDRLAEYLDQGYKRVTELPVKRSAPGVSPAAVKFASIVVFNEHWQPTRYEKARLVPNDGGSIYALLPYRKSNHGRLIFSNEPVYAKEA